MSTHDPERDPVDAISDDFVELRDGTGGLPPVCEVDTPLAGKPPVPPGTRVN